jgi:ketosteroid isomerase-like protein
VTARGNFWQSPQTEGNSRVAGVFTARRVPRGRAVQSSVLGELGLNCGNAERLVRRISIAPSARTTMPVIQPLRKGDPVHKKTMTFWAVLMLGLTARAFSNETPRDQTSIDETAAVEQAARQFYASLNALLAGDGSGMNQVWSHADSVTYMGPDGGIQIGWDQVQTMWDVQAEMKLGGHVEPMNLRITVGNDLALVEGYELGSNPNAQEGPQEFRIRATSSFRKENGLWKMIGHHTDLLDSLDSDSDNPSNRQTGPGANEKPSGDAADDDSIDVSDDEVTLKLER